MQIPTELVSPLAFFLYVASVSMIGWFAYQFAEMIQDHRNPNRPNYSRSHEEVE